MKTTIIAFALAATIGSAAAADLPYATKAPPLALPPSWTGFYIGAQVGGGFSRDNLGITGTDRIGGLAVASGFVPDTLATRQSGFFGGGVVGYNYQVGGPWVIGIEADIDGSGIKGDDSQRLTLGPVSLTTLGSAKLAWFGTVRARAGLLIAPSTLLFATGGLAFGELDVDALVRLTAPAPFGATAAFSSSTTQTGWTVGGGVEHRLWQNWTIGAEYRYLNFGNVGGSFGTTVGAGRLATPVNFAVNQDFNYHLGLVTLKYGFYP